MQLALVLHKYVPLDCGLPVARQVAAGGIPGLHPSYVMTEPV